MSKSWNFCLKFSEEKPEIDRIFPERQSADISFFASRNRNNLRFPGASV